jgi:AcrR family transcriptional regulator
MAVISHGNRTGGRLPHGPHQLTTEQVAADQRERLLRAIVGLVGERGYAATTVADVIARAEVSRKTFYAHFDDRDALLLAAFDETSSDTLEQVRAASQRTGGPTRQVEALMRRLCGIARERPGAIALSTIEIAAAGPDGLERRERLIAGYAELIDECLGGGEEPVFPSMLGRALAGGAHRTIDAHLRTAKGRAQFKALAPELARWVRGYHPVPADLAPNGPASLRWPCAGADGFRGGRAPGTLALAPDGYRPPRAARSVGFVTHANRERILDAVARLTRARGYPTLTAQSIAEHADLSERAFLAHFKNKDDAFATAVEIGHMKGQAILERARSGAPDWRTGVRNAIQGLLEFLASEPDFTRLAFVDAPLAGPAMAHRTHEHARAYARLLLDGAPQRRRPPRVAPEAIVQGLFELAFHYAAQDTFAELPHVAPQATYLVLAPFLGVSEAASDGLRAP